MGLIKDVENTGKVAVLTDIQGLEDFLGDMDFKVAGTAKGITAIQMDIKIKGIDEAILRQALAQAYDGRMHILGKMLEVAARAARRAEQVRAQDRSTSPSTPTRSARSSAPRGKTINKIIEETGVKIDIEDDGSVLHRHPRMPTRPSARVRSSRASRKEPRGRRRVHRQGRPHHVPSARSSNMRPARTA